MMTIAPPLQALDDRRGRSTKALAVYDPYMHKWLTQTWLLMRHYRPWQPKRGVTHEGDYLIMRYNRVYWVGGELE